MVFWTELSIAPIRRKYFFIGANEQWYADDRDDEISNLDLYYSTGNNTLFVNRAPK